MWETDEVAQKYISTIYKRIDDIEERINLHIQNVNMLTGEPVKILTGDEFCDINSESELCRQVIDYYYQRHDISKENEVLIILSACGNVQIDFEGINDCWRHNKSKLKGISFAAIEEVLAKGCMILPWGRYKTSDNKQVTSMIAAPLAIQNTKYICVFVLISNEKGLHRKNLNYDTAPYLLGFRALSVEACRGLSRMAPQPPEYHPFIAVAAQAAACPALQLLIFDFEF